MRFEAAQEMEKELFPPVSIFVNNDGFAFFDVNKCLPTHQKLDKMIEFEGDTIVDNEIVDIETIKDSPISYTYSQPHNFSVCNCHVRYFRIGKFKGDLSTVSVTGSCIMFCAYTTENGSIKSSGVYHHVPFIPYFKDKLRNKLSRLIDTVRTAKEEVFVKAIGGNENKEVSENVIRFIEEVLRYKEVSSESSNFLIGGRCPVMRITKYYPLSGNLVSYIANETYDSKKGKPVITTYIADEKQKTVL
jgi:hypothetical protein